MVLEAIDTINRGDVEQRTDTTLDKTSSIDALSPLSAATEKPPKSAPFAEQRDAASTDHSDSIYNLAQEILALAALSKSVSGEENNPVAETVSKTPSLVSKASSLSKAPSILVAEEQEQRDAPSVTSPVVEEEEPAAVSEEEKNVATLTIVETPPILSRMSSLTQAPSLIVAEKEEQCDAPAASSPVAAEKEPTAVSEEDENAAAETVSKTPSIVSNASSVSKTPSLANDTPVDAPADDAVDTAPVAVVVEPKPVTTIHVVAPLELVKVRSHASYKPSENTEGATTSELTTIGLSRTSTAPMRVTQITVMESNKSELGLGIGAPLGVNNMVRSRSEDSHQSVEVFDVMFEEEDDLEPEPVEESTTEPVTEAADESKAEEATGDVAEPKADETTGDVAETKVVEVPVEEEATKPVPVEAETGGEAKETGTTEESPAQPATKPEGKVSKKKRFGMKKLAKAKPNKLPTKPSSSKGGVTKGISRMFRSPKKSKKSSPANPEDSVAQEEADKTTEPAAESKAEEETSEVAEPKADEATGDIPETKETGDVAETKVAEAPVEEEATKPAPVESESSKGGVTKGISRMFRSPKKSKKSSSAKPEDSVAKEEADKTTEPAAESKAEEETSDVAEPKADEGTVEVAETEVTGDVAETKVVEAPVEEEATKSAPVEAETEGEAKETATTEESPSVPAAKPEVKVGKKKRFGLKKISLPTKHSSSKGSVAKEEADKTSPAGSSD